MLGDGGGGPCEGAGVGGGVLAVPAEGTLGPPTTLVEARRAAPEALPLNPRHLGPEHQVTDVIRPCVGDERGLWQVLPGVNVSGQQGPVALPEDGSHPREPGVIGEAEDRALVGGARHLPKGHLPGKAPGPLHCCCHTPRPVAAATFSETFLCFSLDIFNRERGRGGRG